MKCPIMFKKIIKIWEDKNTASYNPDKLQCLVFQATIMIECTEKKHSFDFFIKILGLEKIESLAFNHHETWHKRQITRYCTDNIRKVSF